MPQPPRDPGSQNTRTRGAGRHPVWSQPAVRRYHAATVAAATARPW